MRNNQTQNNQKRRRPRRNEGAGSGEKDKKQMTIEFRRHESAISPVTNTATFRVGSLVDTQARNAQADLSHLIDASYEYHSPRELRWHLADRLGITPAAVRLKEAA
jgi:hypothetical protein